MKSRCGRILLGMGILLATAVGRATPSIKGAPPAEEYLRRAMNKATVIGDYVFIDGGEIAQTVGGRRTWRASNGVNTTLSIDLSSSWDPEDVEIKEIPKPAPQMVRQGVFNHRSANSFYIWGGQTSYGEDVPAARLWRFSSNGEGGGSWSPETPSNPDTFSSLVRSEGGAVVSTPNAGFWFGGLSVRFSGPDVDGPVPGYVSFNFSTKTWRNHTDAPWSPYGTIYGGSAEYIPTFGPNGLIMLLGGVTDRPGQSGSTGYLDLQNLTFIDPVTRKWYSQPTSGNAPSRRQWHCSVGAESTNGTFEIFVFGGRNLANEEVYDDVYVLSLPGFVWKKASYEAKSPRTAHACVLAGKRQLLSIGGTNSELGAPAFWNDRDPFPQGLGIFDMTKMEWKDEYDADLDDYESPDVIKEWYDDGGLDEVGWSSDEVKGLFEEQRDHDDLDPVPDDGNSQEGQDGNNGGGDGDGDGSSGPPTAAIAGGIVGGLAGIGLIGAAAWYFGMRRRRNEMDDEDGLDAFDRRSSLNSPMAYGSRDRRSYEPTMADLHSGKVDMYDNNSPMAELQGDSHTAQMLHASPKAHHQRFIAELDGTSPTPMSRMSGEESFGRDASSPGPPPPPPRDSYEERLMSPRDGRNDS